MSTSSRSTLGSGTNDGLAGGKYLVFAGLGFSVAEPGPTGSLDDGGVSARAAERDDLRLRARAPMRCRGVSERVDDAGVDASVAGVWTDERGVDMNEADDALDDGVGSWRCDRDGGRAAGV